jgi:hypothetical protein
MSFFTETKGKASVKVLEKCVPPILINPNALAKMQLYVDNCDEEVGWLGTALKQNGMILIDDMFLFQQEVHSTTTEITPEGLSAFGEEIMKLESGMEVWNNLKVWGHSHVRMSTSPSSQDDSQMEKFAENGHDWFIRIIANKNGSLRVDLYEYSQGIIYTDMPWMEAMSAEEQQIMKQMNALEKLLAKIRKDRTSKFSDVIKEEIKQKVKKKYQTYQGTGQTENGKNSVGTTSSYWSRDYGTKYEDFKKNDIKQEKIKEVETKSGIKIEEVKKDDIKVVKTLKDINLLSSAADAFTFLDQDTLLEVGECETLTEVDEVLYKMGYADQFSDSDIKKIWTAGQSLVVHYYGAEKYGV